MEEASVKKVENFPARLFFQDEARFGRMSDPAPCWRHATHRPLIQPALVRQREYINGALCPETGVMEYLRTPDMKTESMSHFLEHVSDLHPSGIIIMVVDGASRIRQKAWQTPQHRARAAAPLFKTEMGALLGLWHLSSLKSRLPSINNNDGYYRIKRSVFS
jgi:hypothetical protein